MKIDHVALWTTQLEAMKDFYVMAFGGKPGVKYHNPETGFESYFISFEGGARLELMSMPGFEIPSQDRFLGYAHIALALGSIQAVDEVTERLGQQGVVIASGPRRTGDGYYESVILDPDGNRVELTV